MKIKIFTKKKKKLFTVMIVVPQWCLSWYPFSDKWVENDPSTFGLYNKSLI